MTDFIIGVRFSKVGKIYHFDASKCPDMDIGDFAIVETSRGKQLGEVVQIIDPETQTGNGKWKQIERRATARDLVLRQLWQKKELEALINCRAKAAELGLKGLKIVSAEFTLDGKRLSFLYNTDGDTKVDLNALRRAMRRTYSHSRIDMRQVGPRDVAKIIGGMGACGMDNRCCSMFLTEFSPISIKMAKTQGISLSPTEITGMCGRLRCCLIYEYEQYLEARKQMPKRNKRVVTPMGEGKVTDIYPLRESVLVQLENNRRQEFSIKDIQPWAELQALKQAAREPCEKHPDGGCDCGKNSQKNKNRQRSNRKGKNQ